MGPPDKRDQQGCASLLWHTLLRSRPAEVTHRITGREKSFKNRLVWLQGANPAGSRVRVSSAPRRPGMFQVLTSGSGCFLERFESGIEPR